MRRHCRHEGPQRILSPGHQKVHPGQQQGGKRNPSVPSTESRFRQGTEDRSPRSTQGIQRHRSQRTIPCWKSSHAQEEEARKESQETSSQEGQESKEAQGSEETQGSKESGSQKGEEGQESKVAKES